MKTCNKCLKAKDFEEFSRNKSKTSGYNSHCNSCVKEYRDNNKDRMKALRVDWRNRNKEYVKQYEYEYKKLRRKEDVNYRIRDYLRSRLRDALKANYRSGSAVNDLGCSIDELKLYLESQFKAGMTWDNWSLNGWHIDHIIPLFKFDLTDPEQLKKAVHYTNLQPLWALENLKKNKF